jgi:hypothetical protein
VGDFGTLETVPWQGSVCYRCPWEICYAYLTFTQGLKPEISWSLFGTTEVVPFQNVDLFTVSLNLRLRARTSGPPSGSQEPFKSLTHLLMREVGAEP